MKVRFIIVLAALVSLAALPARAETVEQWIAKARARLGSESALNSVTSIRYTGSFEMNAGTRLPAEIVFQKPYRQRITVTQPKVVEMTALDDYDAWQRRSIPGNPGQWQMTLLDAAQVKRLRAQTWDNLNFFAGIEKMRGTVQLGGDATVDGVPCVKLVFTYMENMVLTRFIDKTTGRLVKTETENGTEIREEGELIVNGIRFPQKVTNKAPDGKTIIMTFEKIVVNEPLPASEFAVPNLQAS